MEQTVVDLVTQVGINGVLMLMLAFAAGRVIRSISTAFEAQIQSLGDAHNAQVESLSDSVRTLNKSSDRQDTERLSLLKRIQVLEDSRRETDQMLGKAKEDNALLKVKVEQQADKIKTLEHRIEEQVVSMDALRDELKQARLGAGVSDKQSDELRAANVQLTTVNAALQKQVEELQRDNRVIRNEPPPIKDEGDKEAG